MDKMLLNKELGYLGVNVDSNATIDWLKTEVVNKAMQGDGMAVYKLYNFARHSDDDAVKDFANKWIALLDSGKYTDWLKQNTKSNI